MLFIHAPKTGGTSIRESLDCNKTFNHIRIRDLPDNTEKTFSIIRNPYDRAVSMVGHHIKHREITPQDVSEWWRTTNPIRLYKNKEIYFQDPLVDYITINGKQAVDVLLEFEELDSEIKRLFNTDLVHENQSKRKCDYRYYYNEQLYLQITNLYRQDIEMFGYKF